MSEYKHTYNSIISVHSSELFGYFLRSIRAAIINYDCLPIEITVQKCTEATLERGT